MPIRKCIVLDKKNTFVKQEKYNWVQAHETYVTDITAGTKLFLFVVFKWYDFQKCISSTYFLDDLSQSGAARKRRAW